MPTLKELQDLQGKSWAEAQSAMTANDHEKANRYLDEMRERRPLIEAAATAENSFREMKADWDTPVQTVPVTSIEKRDMELNDQEKGWKTDANFKPRGWAHDLETREALGPAIQPMWIQQRMGSNLKEQAAQYTEVYEKWMRAPKELRGHGAFFEEASENEKKLMLSCYDKENGGYYMPEILRRSQSRFRVPEIRAMAELTDTAGGFFSSEDFRPILLHDPGAPGGVIRPRCTVLTTSLRDGYMPTIGSVTWAAMTEGGAYGDNTPNVGQVSFTVRKSGGQVIVSSELLEDTALPLPPIIAQIFMEAKGRYEDQKIIAGDGTTEPEGLRTALGASQTSTFANATSIIATDVLAAYWAVPAQFRQGASWYLTSSLMQQIMGIGATAAGIHFGGGADNVDLRVAPDQVLLGKPIDLFDGTGWDDAVAIAANEQVGAIGNFKNYYLIDRVGMSLKRDDSINVKNDQIWFGARMRFDGRVGVVNAFRLLQAHS